MYVCKHVNTHFTYGALLRHICKASSDCHLEFKEFPVGAYLFFKMLV